MATTPAFNVESVVICLCTPRQHQHEDGNRNLNFQQYWEIKMLVWRLAFKPPLELKSHLLLFHNPRLLLSIVGVSEDNTLCSCLDLKLSSNYCKQNTFLCDQIQQKFTYRQETITLETRYGPNHMVMFYEHYVTTFLYNF